MNRKDAAFFDAFSEHAGKSLEAAKLLAEMLRRMTGSAETGAYGGVALNRAIDEDTLRISTSIKELESAGDRITHDTVRRLRENWLTPFDRGDILELISRLDDVLDFIEEAAERLVLFEVHVAPPESLELSEILIQSCDAVSKAVGLLRSMKNAPEIVKLCVEINRLENAADVVNRKAIAALFKPGNEPLMVMKWRDIFDSLESAADRCEDVADVIEGVVLEYA